MKPEAERTTSRWSKARFLLLVSLLALVMRESSLLDGGGGGPAAHKGGGGVAAGARVYADDDATAECVDAQLARLSNPALYEEARLAPRLPGARPLAVSFPLHPPKFSLALDILRGRAAVPGKEALEWDLFFVFFGDAAAEFKEYVLREGGASLLPLYRAVTVPASILIPFPSFNDRRFPDLKHMFSMALFHPCFEWISVMDVEVKIVKPLQLVGALQARWRRGRNFGMHSHKSMQDYTQQSCTECFSAEDAEKLRRMTNDFNLFSWWSDMPVSLSDDMPAFLAYTGFPERRLCHMDSYEFWRIVQHNWTFVDLTKELGIDDTGLECMDDPARYESWRRAYPPGPVWLPRRFCEHAEGLCESPTSDVVVINHVDREKDNPTTLSMCIKR